MILPAALRRRLGIAKGDRIVIEETDDGLALTTARERRRRSQRIAAKYSRGSTDVVDRFLSDKHLGANSEEEEMERTLRK
ncbi:AbrB/MazE/SpoVT family DNA-binding domain-containing protein [Jannaschia sp. Os4]|nr:AbrB/MazE/SpoVT family DNA-binding domain-containing protein [Jannaschia sp. Os4]